MKKNEELENGRKRGDWGWGNKVEEIYWEISLKTLPYISCSDPMLPEKLN